MDKENIIKKIVIGCLFCLSSAFCTDYSSMSLDELLSQRGTVDEINKDLYRAEMQKRMSDLTPEEKANITQNMSKGNGQKQMLKDGSGSGGMYKGSRGKGGANR